MSHLSSTRWTSRSSPYGASSEVRSASVAPYARLRRNRRPVSAIASPASLASVTCGAGPAAAPDASGQPQRNAHACTWQPNMPAVPDAWPSEV